MKVCSVFDSKSESWSALITFKAVGQALRSFTDAVNGDGEYSRHAEDYTLFLLADFDEQSGVISVLAGPVVLSNGLPLVKSSNQLPLPLAGGES